MRRTRFMAALIAATGGITAHAAAQTIPAGCKTLFDAERKQVMTPTHAFQTRNSANEETISLPTVMYRMQQGKWKKYPVTQQQVLDNLNQTLASGRNYSCQALPDENLAGTAAAVYRAHVEIEGSKSDGKIWIAKATGMLLRQDSDVDSGPSSPKMHMSVRYDYVNVKAPAGVN